MAEFFFAMTTVGAEQDAIQLAKALVKRRLVACANVLHHLHSFYEWKGEFCEEAECLVMMKTTAEQVETLKRVLRDIHPYDEPELIVLPITDGSETYLNWIWTSLKT